MRARTGLHRIGYAKNDTICDEAEPIRATGVNQHPGFTLLVTLPSITFDLSVSERDTLFKHVPLPSNIVARLRFALHTAKGLELTLSQAGGRC